VILVNFKNRRSKKEIYRRLILQKAKRAFGIIQPPLTQQGKISFGQINDGESFWITIQGNHFIITKGGGRFFIDSQKMESAGYKPHEKSIRAMAHTGYTLQELKGFQRKKEEVEKRAPEEEAKIQERKAEKKKIVKEKRGIVREAEKRITESEKQLVKRAGMENKVDSEYDKLKEQVNGHVDKIEGLAPEQRIRAKEIYEKRIKEKIQDSLTGNLVQHAGGKLTNENVTMGLADLDPKKIKNDRDLVNRIDRAVYDPKRIDTVVADVNVKGIDSGNLRKEQREVLKGVAQAEKLREELRVKNFKDFNKMLLVDSKKFGISPQDIPKLMELYEKSKNVAGVSSIYDLLADEWDKKNGTAKGKLLADRGASQQITGMVSKYADIDMDIGKMIRDMGTEKAIQLVSADLKNKLSPKKYNELIENIINHNVQEMDAIERRVMNDTARLKKQMSKYEDELQKRDGKSNDLLDRNRAINLDNQRKLLWIGQGQLNAMGEFYTALKKVKENPIERIRVNLNVTDLELAKQQYRNIVPSKDRKNTRISQQGNKFFVDMKVGSLSDYYTKSKEKDTAYIKELKDIKYKKYNSETWDMSNTVFGNLKKNLGFRPMNHQVQNIEFFNKVGGSGICSVTTGGGKTLISMGVHAKMVEDAKKEGRKHTTIMAVPKDQVFKMEKEATTQSNLKVMAIPPDATQALEMINNLKPGEADNHIVYASHDVLAYEFPDGTKLGDKLKEKINPDALHLDEPQVLMGRTGDLSAKGQAIQARFRKGTGGSEIQKLMFTATPMKQNPAEIINMLSFTHGDKEPQFNQWQKRQTKERFGGKVSYGTGHEHSMIDTSILDSSKGIANTFQEHFKDMLEKYTTNTHENFLPFDYSAKQNNVRIPDKFRKAHDDITGKSNQSRWFADKSESAKEKIEGTSRDMVLRDKRKSDAHASYLLDQTQDFLRHSMGADNPLTKKFVTNVMNNKKERHLVFVDSAEHEKHVRDHLKNAGYNMDQVNSMAEKNKKITGPSIKSNWAGKSVSELVQKYYAKESNFKHMNVKDIESEIVKHNSTIIKNGIIQHKTKIDEATGKPKSIGLVLPNRQISQTAYEHRADKTKKTDGKPGILFVSKDNLQGLNLQMSHQSHALGSFKGADGLLQWEGRIIRPGKNPPWGEPTLNHYGYEDSSPDIAHRESIREDRRKMNFVNPMAGKTLVEK